MASRYLEDGMQTFSGITCSKRHPFERIPRGVEPCGAAFAAFTRVFNGSVEFTTSAPTFKCGSMASRAMKRRMISLLPSKMVLMRESREKPFDGLGDLTAGFP